MGDLTVGLATTLTGFIADRGGGTDWIVMGEERAAYFVEAVENADAPLPGRQSHQGFVSCRDVPNNPEASEAEKNHRRTMQRHEAGRLFQAREGRLGKRRSLGTACLEKLTS